MTELTYDFGYGDDPAAFLGVAQALENTGVQASNGSGQFLTDPGLEIAAGGIVAVEARHASDLNDLNDDVPFPASFEMPLTPEEVLGIATPFIAAAPAAQVDAAAFDTAGAGRGQAPDEVVTAADKGDTGGSDRRNRVNEMPSVGIGTGLRLTAHVGLEQLGLVGLAGVAAAASIVLAYRGRAIESATAGSGVHR